MDETKNHNELTRRDFHKLTVAAFGGVLGGSLLAGRAMALQEENPMLKEPHVCCGLNTCKGKGAGSSNDCAGMGNCATAERHSCQGQGACAGQGGCGETAGANACKGQGECAVPLKASTWKKARARFEAAMKEAGQKFGPAPEGCPA
ncbi:MAG: twin-arginine translocation signal domain-containing protein [Acidobacteriota bacterium]